MRGRVHNGKTLEETTTTAVAVAHNKQKGVHHHP